MDKGYLSTTACPLFALTGLCGFALWVSSSSFLVVIWNSNTDCESKEVYPYLWKTQSQTSGKVALGKRPQVRDLASVRQNLKLQMPS